MLKNKYKFKKRNNLISEKKIFIIIFFCFISLGIAYSINSSNLNISGRTTLYQEINALEPGTLQLSGLTITIDDSNIITINGTLKGNANAYIKISNGLVGKVINANNLSYFSELISSAPKPLLSKDSTLVHQIDVLSGTWDKSKQFNVVIRDFSNTAIANCKLSSNITNVTEKLNCDAMVEYFYIQAGSSFNNVKIKTHIRSIILVEESVDVDLKLIPESSTYKDLTCTINSDGSITLDGTAKSKAFIKLNERNSFI